MTDTGNAKAGPAKNDQDEGAPSLDQLVGETGVSVLDKAEALFSILGPIEAPDPLDLPAVFRTVRQALRGPDQADPEREGNLRVVLGVTETKSDSSPFRGGLFQVVRERFR
jgi:hypothetical protein